MDFKTLEEHTRKVRLTVSLVSDDTITLCFDPGHTTGYAVFEGLDLVESGELVTKPIEQAVENIKAMFDKWQPNIVVMEDYRVYKWKTKHHGGSELLTTRVIGCIETFSVLNFVPFTIKQPAHTAKGFCTDPKLKEWGFYQVGLKHARDAIRHGCYFLLFGAVNRKEAQQFKGTVG